MKYFFCGIITEIMGVQYFDSKNCAPIPPIAQSGPNWLEYIKLANLTLYRNLRVLCRNLRVLYRNSSGFVKKSPGFA